MAGEAGMRQRKGGANGAGGAAPGAPGPALGQPQMVNKGFKFGFCQSLSVFLIFVILCVCGLVAMAMLVPMRIHSCEIYVPHKIQAMTNTFNSLAFYGERETYMQLYNELSAAIYSEALNYQPPVVRLGWMQGKHLLMVGGTRTPVALQRAAQLGVKLTIIDDASAYGFVKNREGPLLTFFPAPNFGKFSLTHPEEILSALRQYLANGGKVQFHGQPADPNPTPIAFDGVFTLVEDHGPITAYIAEGLGLKGSPYKAAQTARSKLAVRQAMQAAGLKVPRFAAIKSDKDVAAAGKKVGFPAFVKPVFGVQATFAAKVADEDELLDTVRDFQARFDTDHHPIYHYGTEMILESLIKGSEVQLELLLSEGRVVAHSFSSEYSERRDTLSFPPTLEDTRKQRLFDLAKATVTAVGLTDGAVHIELFDHPEEGPQVVEVNNRLTRGFLGHNFAHQLLFGQHIIDYYGAVFSLSMGGAPMVRARNTSMLHLAVLLDDPSTDWWHVDPKDAPNRGWEREGRCGVFVGYNASHALAQAKASQAARHAEGEAYVQRVKSEDFHLLIWATLALVASLLQSMRLFFIGIYEYASPDDTAS